MYTDRALTTLSPEEIRAFIVERLKVALPGLPLEPRHGEPYRLTLTHPDAGELVLNLGNLVQEVRGASPGSAQRLVDTFVNLAQRAVAGPNVALDKVYPGLRHHDFMRDTSMLQGDALVGDGPGDLVSVVLADQGDGVAILSEKMVHAAGYQTEDVLLAAEQNLVNLLPDIHGELSQDGKVLSLGFHDHPWLGTSLLFVPALITNAMQQLGWNHALMAAPTRDTIDLVDASEDQAAKVMERWMQERLAGPRTQSETVLSYRCDRAEYHKAYRMAGSRLVRLN